LSSYFQGYPGQIFMLDIQPLPGYNTTIISWKFLSKAPEAESIRPCLGQNDTIQKSLTLVKVKKGDNFNHSNI
jgi:hypothetical protein